jgi:hypothetical protein
MGESMRKHVIVISGLLLAGTAGCVGDRLQVENLNNPDVARAFATPQGVEGVIAGLGAQLFNPQRASESVNTQAKILAGENFATVNNFGMAPRSLIPQGAIDNSIGNNVQSGNLANYNSFQRIARSANNAIRSLDAIIAAGNTLGSPAQNARAKSFAFFILGQALGFTSFGYDSAAIVTPTIPSDSVPGLSPAAAVNAAAVAMLDSAVAIASSANATSGSNGFPLPTNWINGTSYSRDDFVRLVRSFRARIRAGGARTPQERAALPWNLIIADATNGITRDHDVTVNTSLGWTAGYDTQQMYVEGGWHQLPIWYIGMADTSGNYDAWLATPRTTRSATLIRTPDTRWPQGDTRAAQNAEAPTIVLPVGRYIRNRPPADDVVGTEWGFSMYDHRRYGRTRVAGNIGPYTDMSATEISMLAAEGYIRTGQVALAIPLINASRTRNGLQPIPAGTSATQPIGTLPNCVPRVPQPPNFTSTACGTVLEAMKYEKRMETQFTGYMIWFTDSRGWGDLPQGAPLDWPVPYQELQSRRQDIYNGDAARVTGLGTYGFR